MNALPSYLEEYWQRLYLAPLLDRVDLSFASSLRAELRAILQSWCLQSAERLEKDELSAKNCIALLSFLLEGRTEETLESVLAGFLSHPIESVALECHSKMQWLKFWNEQRESSDGKTVLRVLERKLKAGLYATDDLLRDFVDLEFLRRETGEDSFVLR